MEGDALETAKITVRLPKEDLELAKRYAEAHRITVAELIGRYLRSLRTGARAIHPEVERIAGLIPPEVDARGQCGEHLRRKRAGS